MEELERFWRAVEAGAPIDDPAGGALGEAVGALLRLNADAAASALAEVDVIPDAWSPVLRLARVLHATFSPDRDGLIEGARALHVLLEELDPRDPTWPRAAHQLAAISLRLAQAEDAERWAAEALARLTRGAEHRVAWALDTAGTAFARTGAWEEARGTYAATVRVKRAIGDALGVAITAGSWGRMELDLGRARDAERIAEEGDSDALPTLTRVRLRTLMLEAAVEEGAAEAVDAHATALEALLAEVDDAHHLAGYASLALGLYGHGKGDDPTPLLERAARSLHLPLGAALLSYWRRRLSPDGTDDAAWLASVQPDFDTLGVCTMPEVLSHLHVAERRARADVADANRMLDALSTRVAQSNNPLFFRWLDDAGERVDPRAASRRRMRRYLGPQAGSLEGTARIDATIVFSDLVGFTKRSVALEPEAVMDTVRSVFELASPLLLAHRVEPLQYLGDGLLALAFGDGHEERGLAFAEALCARMRRVSAIRAAHRDDDASLHRMNVRCGVASGPVVLGPIGNLLRTEHLAIGLTTNRAARLQGYAEPDEVVCDGGITDRGAPFEVSPKGLDPFVARRLTLGDAQQDPV